MNIRQAIGAGAILAASAATARADVIVVDPQGGPGEALLKAAMDIAQDGDILLLEAGDYSSGLDSYISIGVGPSFAIVADSGVDPVLRGLHLGGREVLLRGIDIRAPAGQPPTGTFHGTLHLEVGNVWVEDCELHGRDGFGTAGSYKAAAATWIQMSQVVFTHCRLEGGSGANDIPGGYPDASAGYSGVRIEGSSDVTLADCIVQGGNAGDGLGLISALNGGDGLWVQTHGPNDAVTVWISGSQLTGGNDGADGPALAEPGSGIFAQADNLVNAIFVRDSAVHAGQIVGAGVQVPDIDTPAEVLYVLPASARSCSVPAPLRAGQAAKLTIAGKSGDIVLLVVSPTTFTFKMKPGLQGAIDFAAWDSYPIPPLAIVDASGVREVPFRLPPLPADFGGGLTLIMQGVFFGSDGETLGAPTSLVWLDAGI